MKQSPSICILGAGVSGISMMKALGDRGIAYTAFEKSDQLGGNWVFQNKNGMSSAYRSLHIDSSRYSIEFDDFPFPAHFPDFPHHSLIAEYFREYARHFGIDEKISFNAGVQRAYRSPEGGWRIQLESGEVRRFDLLVVANGHHWDARWPEPAFKGTFDGIQMHSHQYIDTFTPHDFHGKRVLVVGMGNSAMDIACELSHRTVAARVVVSTRRGAHVIPKYLFGRPIDAVIRMRPWLPQMPQRWLGAALVRLAVGKMESYGLPCPGQRIWQAHPTVSSEFLIRAGSGDITVKPNVAELRGQEVAFVDGSSEAFDAIIYATGYKISFPFFDSDILDVRDNHFPLFKRALIPGVEDLIFVGFAQAVPSIIKFVEIQARWLAAYVSGEYETPDRNEMQRIMERDQSRAGAAFVASQRHTMQVDTNLYAWDLAKEWRRGARRASRWNRATLATRP